MIMDWDLVFFIVAFSLSTSSILSNGMLLLCSKVWPERSRMFLPLGLGLNRPPSEFFFFGAGLALVFADFESWMSVRKNPEVAAVGSFMLGSKELECLVVFGYVDFVIALYDKISEFFLFDRRGDVFP